jgi:asparagine synthase (glutamine-hydrolysing)
MLLHTRLAIIDCHPRSNQPFTYGQTTISYNGELWNFREVRALLAQEGCSFQTNGDTEVMAAALDRWGAAALPRFDGMFAVAWTKDGQEVSLARDRYGEIPLHWAPGAFASERKALLGMGIAGHLIQDVPPGGLLTLCPSGARITTWYALPAREQRIDRLTAADRLRTLLEEAVTARQIADVPLATLFSGGLDSATIAAILVRSFPGIPSYIAVYDPRSPDLRAARIGAEALGLTLREVRVPSPTADDLAGVVRVIEMSSKAQVEIGWPCLALARAMQADGIRVIFSGEGSDELWASYGFSYHGIQQEGWGPHRRKLIRAQAAKNFARCNKIFMAAGIECRLPFLSPPLVEYALSLPQATVQDRGRPKAVLQDAVGDWLPSRLRDRPKLAFQDGLGMKSAAAQAVAQPARFYRQEYARTFG